jgi:hypothetical protein
MIGAAFNSRILLADLHAVLNFLHAKKCNQFAKKAQITCCGVAKGNRFFCNAEHVSYIPLGELHFKLIKRRPDNRIFLPSAIDIHSKVYPTIPLSG